VNFLVKHWGIVLFFVGVLGEIVRDFTEEKRLRAHLRIFFIVVLALGLGREILKTIRSDKEIAASHKRAALAEERAALENDRARSNELVILKFQPRRIALEQKQQFIDFASQWPRADVTIVSGSEYEPAQYAHDLKQLLDAAGFKSQIRFTDIKGGTPIRASNEYPLFLMMFAEDKQHLSWPGMTFSCDGATKLPVTRILDQTLATPGVLNRLFQKVGINATWFPDTNLVKRGQWAIYIPEK